MSRRRRAALLLGLALVLGALAAGDVGRRERALASGLGPSVPVVVARTALEPGRAVGRSDVTVRRVPRRYAPADRIGAVGEIVGQRPRLAVPPGADVSVPMLDDGAGPQLRPGERIADIVAIGDPQQVRPGGRIDLLVTRGSDGAEGTTRLALENAEVVTTGEAPSENGDGGGGRIAVALRVTVKQAVYLAAAQNFASELRVLPRGPGDDGSGAAGTTARSTLEGTG
ncbi:RcpC/CpaB family pilus assembly protein [Patulibacter sp.]|uniref:RcpC/CpaB family pilus assembly protein n=1 Tax=Patulibacter sp. TaxID=1912859 RepID=UPI00271A2AB8|nr:RcpC/CpaB family pilus assembly protein [Patulibacter sp.]MDO9409701.1 SAF domain-containing protein [Patulibacter sp.]